MIQNKPARSLHSHVVQELGLRIVSGKLLPGDLLPREERLAENLQVSRTALREAMKVLSAKGLVEARPKVGTRVRDARFWHQLDADILAWRCASMPTENFVQKLLEMREIIEPAAAASAARNCNAQQLEQLEKAFAGMQDAEDLDAWANADLNFHEAILTATNNELLVSLFSVIATALGTFFVLSARNAKDFKYSLPHHSKVLEAIRRREPEVARSNMQRMVADSRNNMKQRTRDRSQG